jgi:FtsZ-binding cell division protein ZapB
MRIKVLEAKAAEKTTKITVLIVEVKGMKAENGRLAQELIDAKAQTKRLSTRRLTSIDRLTTSASRWQHLQRKRTGKKNKSHNLVKKQHRQQQLSRNPSMTVRKKIGKCVLKKVK